MRPRADFDAVLTLLGQFGLLLESDARLPAVAPLVAGEPVRGSWWGHRRSHAIFGVLKKLAAHDEVLTTKLVSGKVTFVDRRLWPALIAVGVSREAWQMRGLSSKATALLHRLELEGELEASGEAARELEERLLAQVEQIHTEKGSHAKRLRSWARWASQAGLPPELLLPAAARREIEETLAVLNRQFRAAGRLPWQVATKKPPRR